MDGRVSFRMNGVEEVEPVELEMVLKREGCEKERGGAYIYWREGEER